MALRAGYYIRQKDTDEIINKFPALDKEQLKKSYDPRFNKIVMHYGNNIWSDVDPHTLEPTTEPKVRNSKLRSLSRALKDELGSPEHLSHAAVQGLGLPLLSHLRGLDISPKTAAGIGLAVAGGVAAKGVYKRYKQLNDDVEINRIQKIKDLLFENRVIDFPQKNDIRRASREKTRPNPNSFDVHSLTKKLMRPSAVSLSEINSGSLNLNHELLKNVRAGSYHHWMKVQDAFDALLKHGDESAFSVIKDHLVPHALNNFKGKSDQDLLNFLLASKPGPYGYDAEAIYNKHILPK